MQQKKRKRGLKIDRRLLIFFSIMPVGCLVALLVGLVVAWQLLPTRYVDARMSELSEDQAQEIVVMVAADFAQYHDLERTKEALAQLKVPNTAQYVSLVAERMVRTNRGEVDQDIKNVVNLAEALGVSTISMIAYVSTATSTPTSTSTPTPTPTNTPVVPTSTNTPVIPPTDTPLPVPPTATPAPKPVATNTPAAAPVPTNTPPPPAAPASEFDFVITKQRLLTKDENGGCLGMHSIFVTVTDANGAPIKGVQMGDVWNNPGPITGHKGDDKPGLAVYDLYKNALKIFVKSDPTAGKQVTSQVSDLLSTNDWEIGIPRLLEAGYCPDEGTCRVLWNSGVFGVGNNSLCWGHYSWEITFKRAW